VLTEEGWRGGKGGEQKKWRNLHQRKKCSDLRFLLLGAVFDKREPGERRSTKRVLNLEEESLGMRGKVGL